MLLAITAVLPPRPCLSSTWAMSRVFDGGSANEDAVKCSADSEEALSFKHSTYETQLTPANFDAHGNAHTNPTGSLFATSADDSVLWQEQCTLCSSYSPLTLAFLLIARLCQCEMSTQPSPMIISVSSAATAWARAPRIRTGGRQRSIRYYMVSHRYDPRQFRA